MTREFFICHVKPDSPADKAGIEPGDRLFWINEKTPYDILDYQYLSAGRDIQISIKKRNGPIKNIVIEKQYDEDPGLEFENPTMSPLRKCRNNCVFCFVDQQPPGLRNSLYEKDDDYRLSFLYGNYITLTNAGRLDLKRIARRLISPLYLSIHTTVPEIRQRMMRNPAAGRILSQMKYLAAVDIKMHGQIVLCPGINDGEVLEKTIEDLSELYPNLETVAIVPVGLSRHREHLIPLQGVTREKAETLIGLVTFWQEKFLKKFGTPFVYLADEFYLLANEALPSDDHYGAYQQLENGVGLGRLFLNELETWITQTADLSLHGTISLVTGRSAEPLLTLFIDEIKKNESLNVRLHVVESLFWGNEVTVAGLLTGSDLLKALKDKELGDVVIIPSVMLKENTKLFLDNLSVDDLSRSLKTPVIPVDGLQDIRHLLNTTAL